VRAALARDSPDAYHPLAVKQRRLNSPRLFDKIPTAFYRNSRFYVNHWENNNYYAPPAKRQFVFVLIGCMAGEAVPQNLIYVV
jgi:hypothetical protein